MDSSEEPRRRRSLLMTPGTVRALTRRAGLI